MEKAIKKAIEGGYSRSGVIKNFTPQNREFAERSLLQDYKICLLDPLFWQALGKAEGWKDWFFSYYRANTGREEFNGRWIAVDSFGEIPKELQTVKGMWRQHPQESPDWKYHWHSFIDYLAEGKDAESFFNELLK